MFKVVEALRLRLARLKITQSREAGRQRDLWTNEIGFRPVVPVTMSRFLV